jgi:hypothetical protein
MPRDGYFAAALRRANAVTMSFCASAMALLAVVMLAPASLFGNCSPRKSTSATRKFCRSDGQAPAISAPKSCSDRLLLLSRGNSRARQF